METRLRESLSEVPAVALLGARQVGKTTLAKAIAADTPSIYLDLEAPGDLLKLSDPMSTAERTHFLSAKTSWSSRFPSSCRKWRLLGRMHPGSRERTGRSLVSRVLFRAGRL